jgi:hypothetical protein
MSTQTNGFDAMIGDHAETCERPRVTPGESFTIRTSSRDTGGSNAVLDSSRNLGTAYMVNGDTSRCYGRHISHLLALRFVGPTLREGLCTWDSPRTITNFRVRDRGLRQIPLVAIQVSISRKFRVPSSTSRAK